MRTGKSIILMLLVLIVAGCVSTKSVMESWMGSHIDDAVASWGAPESRISRSDGGYTYTWETLSASQYSVSECKQTLTTNERGIIVSWAYRGCPKNLYK
jgi:hypothetical protein